jgi:hypothetical protein
MKCDDTPEYVWMVATELSGNTRYWYAGAETEEEAIAMIAVPAIGEPVTDAKRIRNVEGVQANEWRLCPQGSPPDSWEG